MTGCRCAPTNVSALHYLIAVETVNDKRHHDNRRGAAGEFREAV